MPAHLMHVPAAVQSLFLGSGHSPVVSSFSAAVSWQIPQESRTPGTFGIQQRRNNICENHMHNFMHANDLKAMITCFQHKRYDTRTHPNSALEVHHQLDHCAKKGNTISHQCEKMEKWERLGSHGHQTHTLTPGNIKET